MKYEDEYTLECKKCGKPTIQSYGVRGSNIEPTRKLGRCGRLNSQGIICNGEFKKNPSKNTKEHE